MSVAHHGGNRVARMAKLDASAVATLLIEIGRRLVLAGENPYKARAYSRAAQNLLTLTLPLGEVIAAGRLREIPGVGEALAATIEQLYARGTTPKLEALRADAPVGVLEMLRIPMAAPSLLLHRLRLLARGRPMHLLLQCSL